MLFLLALDALALDAMSDDERELGGSNGVIVFVTLLFAIYWYSSQLKIMKGTMLQMV